MKLLITGTSTLLGSQVFGWFKHNYPEMRISTLNDCSDMTAVGHLFATENYDAVIHLAGAGKCHGAGTNILLDAANDCWQGSQLTKRFLYISAESSHVNARLLRKYKDMSLVISSCTDSFASHNFPREFIPLADENLRNNKHVPLYVNGQKVSAWFWASSEACAIDVLFHQGEAGVIYNIGGVNSWESSTDELSSEMYKHAYAQEPIFARPYQSFMVKVKRIFSNLAADLNV